MTWSAIPVGPFTIDCLTRPPQVRVLPVYGTRTQHRARSVASQALNSARDADGAIPVRNTRVNWEQDRAASYSRRNVFKY